MHFTPKDQIVLLAGLDTDRARRKRLWSHPQLQGRLDRLTGAGLIDGDGLSQPAGVEAARSLHHITLDDLIAEHLTDGTAGAASEAGS